MPLTAKRALPQWEAWGENCSILIFALPADFTLTSFSFEVERDQLHLLIWWQVLTAADGVSGIWPRSVCVKVVESSACSSSKLLYCMGNVQSVALDSVAASDLFLFVCFYSFYNQQGRNICFDQSSFYFLLLLPPGTSFYHVPQLHAYKHYKQVVKCLSHQI